MATHPTPALLACLLLFGEALACAGISSRGPVPIAGEEALVVWNPETRIEHFVRTAAFDGAPADFGFLVPTPSKPELAEVDDPFPELFALYRAPLARGLARGGSAMAYGSGAAVEVVERKAVAGMDATVLRASDAGALAGWLEVRGFANPPPLRAWLEKYVAAGWYVTAFRIQPGADSGAVRTRAVRMSFETPWPVYPYSEPAVEEQPRRPLRVSFAAPFRVEGRTGSAWIEPGFAGTPAGLGDLLRRSVPERDATLATWLTVFDEARSLRGAVDLTFARAAEQVPAPSRIHQRLAPRVRPAARVTVPADRLQVSGGLTPEVVRRVVRRHGNALRYCQDLARKESPAVVGELLLSVVVGAEGEVESAEVKHSTVGSTMLPRCVLQRVRRLRFPPPTGAGVVRLELPLRFAG